MIMNRMRIDFDVEYEKTDDPTVFRAIMTPSKDRYERLEDGSLLDKLDNCIISKDAFQHLVQQMEGQPVLYDPPQITNSEEYLRARVSEIQRQVKEEFLDVEQSNDFEDFLENIAGQRWSFVLLCIDMVGSTKLAEEDEEAYQKIVPIYLNEVSRVVKQFNGHIIDYAGDGLLAHFPAPNFIGKNDLAIDCGLCLIKLIYETLNPVFSEVGLPPIQVRVGFESGDAKVASVGNPSTKRAFKVLGKVVNLAAKIQSIAAPGSVALGENAERNLHSSWRKLCYPVQVSEWEYINDEGLPYGVFQVNYKLKIPKVGRNKQCPCGSRKKYKHCHLRLLS